MRHQTLIELRSLIDDILRKMTNDSYTQNYKFSFNLEWNKGTGTIQSPIGENITQYYILKFYFIDKTQSSVGQEVVLSESYYPTKSNSTSEKQEETAYKEFVLNGTRCMYNILYDAIWQQQQQKIVRPEDITNTDLIVEDLKHGSNQNKIITELGHINSVSDLLKKNGIDIKPKGKA